MTAVADGQAALDAAAERPFDIVLLDVALGAGPTGHDVARMLRSRRDVVPIIMLTALDSEADAVQGLESGADDYVTKPFGLAELRSRIRAVLRRAQGRVVEGSLHGRPGRARPRPAPRDRRRRRRSSSRSPSSSCSACLMSRPGLRVQPPGAAARDLGRQRLPRPAGDRRPHPPPAREARAAARGAEPDPHRARHRLPLPGVMRRRAAGRPALAAAARPARHERGHARRRRARRAAAAAGPPARRRAPTASRTPVRDGDRATFQTSSNGTRLAAASDHGAAPRRRRRDLNDQTDARVLVMDDARRCRATASTAPPGFLYDTESSSPSRRARQLMALRGDAAAGRRVTEFDGDSVLVAAPLYGTGGDVAGALVAERRADRGRPRSSARCATRFADRRRDRRSRVAALLAIALSSTLLRRLARLRAAALRITDEGPDAPTPHDDRRDEVGDLGRALARMQEELRRQEAARRAFVSTASHELRTPLTMLQGTMELLEEDLRAGRLDELDALRQVANARRELDRLSALVGRAARPLAPRRRRAAALRAGRARRDRPRGRGRVRAARARALDRDRRRAAGRGRAGAAATPTRSRAWCGSCSTTRSATARAASRCASRRGAARRRGADHGRRPRAAGSRRRSASASSSASTAAARGGVVGRLRARARDRPRAGAAHGRRARASTTTGGAGTRFALTLRSDARAAPRPPRAGRDRVSA